MNLKIFNHKKRIMLLASLFIAVFIFSAMSPALAIGLGRTRKGIFVGNATYDQLIGASGQFYSGNINTNWLVDIIGFWPEHYCQLAMVTDTGAVAHYVECGIDVFKRDGTWHKALFLANDRSLVYYNESWAESHSEPYTLTIIKTGMYQYTLYANMEQMTTVTNYGVFHTIMTEFEGMGLPYQSQYNIWVGGVHNINIMPMGNPTYWLPISITKLSGSDWNWGNSVAGYLTAGGWDCRINW